MPAIRKEQIADVPAIFVLHGLKPDKEDLPWGEREEDLFQHGLAVKPVDGGELATLDPLKTNAPEDTDLWRNLDPRGERVGINYSQVVDRTREVGR